MIHVEITAELQADEYGPHAVYTEQIVLPHDFATDAKAAHAKLVTMIVTESYFELPGATV